MWVRFPPRALIDPADTDCMATSQNGYEVIFEAEDPRLRVWKIPGTNRTLKVRADSCGYVLAFIALWFHETVEPIDQGIWDEWGWAVRPVRGQTTGYSNHASGTAIDLNATLHPRGVSGTFTAAKDAVIRNAMLTVFKTVVRWGGTYVNSPVDGMHFEIVKGSGAVAVLATALKLTNRGRRLHRANI